MSQKSVRVLVEGRVQGVFFRKFVKDNALMLGVKGFVQNNEDGSVMAVCVGNIGSIEKLLEKIRAGPTASSVKKVTVTSAGQKEFFSSFEIRY